MRERFLSPCVHWGWLSTIIVCGVIVGVFVCESAAPRAAEQNNSLSAEQTKAFQWFSLLGYPDARDLKFIRVATGQWSQSGSAPQQNSFSYGFLLREHGKKFTALIFPAKVTNFEMTPKETAAYQRVGYEVENLPGYVRATIKALREHVNETGGIEAVIDNQSRFARYFVLAWACWRKGQYQFAAELFNEDATISGKAGGDDASKPLQTVVAAQLAYVEIWSATLKFDSPQIPRSDLLATFRQFVTRYPESEYAAKARDTAAILKRMVREDQEHAATQLHARQFGQLSRHDQIAELIFQLRDQHGTQSSQPGTCDVFSSQSDRGHASPADRLVAYGYDAVPQLIAALDDTRFSRSIGYFRNFEFSHYVLTVGDCAEAILSQIAARPFFMSTNYYDYMDMHGKAAEVKARAESWYAELRRKGEKRLLIEAVERASDDDAGSAERLVEKYPDVAIAALTKGFRHTASDFVRASYINAAGKLSGGAPVPFLLELLNHGKAPEERVAAATALGLRMHVEAVTAMIAELKKLGEAEQEGVVDFLAGCGEARAIDALDTQLETVHAADQVRILMAICDDPSFAQLFGLNTCDSPPAKSQKVRDNRELKNAIIRLLLKSLEFTDSDTGTVWDSCGMEFRNPRICDIGGGFLNQIDPKRYPYRLQSSLAERDRSRVAIINASR